MNYDAEAMVSHLAALEALARIHGWDVLAYLLAIARAEAQAISRSVLVRT